MNMKSWWLVVICVVGLASAVPLGCSAEQPASSQPAVGQGQDPAESAEEDPLIEEEEATPSLRETDFAIQRLMQPWTGDLDGMVARRAVRMLVAYGQTSYFLDLDTQRGISYEAGKLFEDEVNKQLGSGVMRLNVVFIPVTRDELIPMLLAGKGDIAAANLTITPEREAEVDFSKPFLSNVRELVVTGRSAPPLARLEDLAGQDVFVRPSSSYYASVLELNKKFESQGLAPIRIQPADEFLETEDILEMVSAGLVSITIADDHIAQFWDQIIDIDVHEDLAVREGGQIGWAFRKGSPQLKQAVDSFAVTHGKGTLMGNILFKRYLQNVDYVKNARAPEDVERLRQAVEFFRRYGDQYDLDWLLMAAQAYQESKIDQSVRSHVGAIGVMQVLPSTAADRNVNIPNIEEIEPNIHAGIKYMRFMIDHYFADEDMDQLNKAFFALASYNAGPARVARLRKEAAENGLDPNVWFRNVEVIAAKRIGRETVQYVSNIYKYYVAYKLIAETLQQRSAAGSDR